MSKIYLSVSKVKICIRHNPPLQSVIVYYVEYYMIVFDALTAAFGHGRADFNCFYSVCFI